MSTASAAPDCVASPSRNHPEQHQTERQRAFSEPSAPRCRHDGHRNHDSRVRCTPSPCNRSCSLVIVAARLLLMVCSSVPTADAAANAAGSAAARGDTPAAPPAVPPPRRQLHPRCFRQPPLALRLPILRCRRRWCGTPECRHLALAPPAGLCRPGHKRNYLVGLAREQPVRSSDTPGKLRRSLLARAHARREAVVLQLARAWR
jgi:hypothetical protein